MLELEDFSIFARLGSQKEKEVKEEVKRCERELLRLKELYAEEIERVKKEFFERGYQEGLKRAREEALKLLKEREEELRRNFESEVKRLRLNIDGLLAKIESEGRKRVNLIEKALLDGVEEVLTYLYIEPSNGRYLKKAIYALVEELSEEEPVKVEVGKALAELLEGERFEVNPELGDYDFRVLFKDFKVESRFKEKLKLLRSEIEGEVKEAT
ncbi:hypothetical protein [Thermovibrio sp.]